jgi:2-methylcitrate dehydratase PrpD
MMAQYSLPFCVALAHYREPRDPASFNLRTFNDPAIRALAARVTISVADEARHGHTIASTVTVKLTDGRTLSRRVDSFKGTPEQPLDHAEMRDKFLLLTKACDGRAMARLFDRLQNLEAERNLDWIKVVAAKPTAKRAAKTRIRAAARRRMRRQAAK